MPRRCTICTHPAQAAIDEAMQAGVSYRHTAARFSVSPSSLVRHHQHQAPQHEQGHLCCGACACRRVDWHAWREEAQQLCEQMQTMQVMQDAYRSAHVLRAVTTLLVRLADAACRIPDSSDT